MGIKTPPSYEHPSKRKRQDQKQEPQAQANVERTGKPNRGKRDVGSKRLNLNSQKTPDNIAEMVRVRVVAYDPIPGEIKRFDEMMRSGLLVKEALLGMLRKSKDQIDSLVELGPRDIEALTFEHGRTFVETNWSIPAEKAVKLKLLIDPFDILTPRSLGIKIGIAVIILGESN